MTKTSILIAEDESLVAKDIERSLKKMGYAIWDVVSLGKEVIAATEDKKPDLVLMDIKLEGDMDGITAAEHMRQRGIPVIFLTAHSDKDTLSRAKISEPYGYILKPFSDQDIHTAVEMALYKHKMEMKLRESEQWLLTTLRSIGDAVIVTDKEGKIILMNYIAEVITGWKEKDALGKEAGDVFCIQDEITGEKAESPLDKVLRDGRIVGLTNHTVLVAKDGRHIPIDDSGAPILLENGELTGVVLVFRDISERRKVEITLQESEMRFRSVFENARDAIIVTDDSGEIILWNHAAEHMFRKKQIDAVGRNISIIFPERFYDTYQQNSRKVLALQDDSVLQKANSAALLFEISGVGSNDDEIPLEISMASWNVSGRIFFTHIVFDISLRKRIESEKEKLIMDMQEALNRVRSIHRTDYDDLGIAKGANGG